MNKTIIALSALLAVQVAVAVDLNVRSSALAGEQAKVALLGFPAGDVSRLAITNADGQTVTLAKTAKGWVLPDHKDFPADGEKVKRLLNDLASAQEGAPIATSSGAAGRFKVADKTFERKVVFGPADKPKATVYFGASQGARQVDVRRSDQRGVRRIDFGIYRLEANVDNWVDNTVLQTAPEKITGLAWGKVRLQRKTVTADAKTASDATAAATTAAGGKTTDKASGDAVTWMLGAANPQPVSGDAAGKIVAKLATLTLTGLAAEPPKADAPPVVDLTITLKDGKTRELKLWQEKDSSFVVEAWGVPAPAKLSKATGEALLSTLANPAFEPKAAQAAPADQHSAATPAHIEQAGQGSQQAVAAPDAQAKQPVAPRPAGQQTAAAPPVPATPPAGATHGG